MKRFLPFAIICLFGIGLADAAVRDANSVSRAGIAVASNNRTISAPATTGGNSAPSRASAANASRGDVATTSNTTVRARATVGRSGTTTVSRAAISRAATNATTTARSATNTASARTARAATNAASARGTTTARSATATGKSRAALSRAATTTVQSNTFGTGYNTCRDAYFTCMDQFCANQNDSYRRCVCSSRLTEVQSRERALSQASDQIQDFKDLNIEVIPKTAAEVKAMLTASEGEYAASAKKDSSESAQKLAGISDVLQRAKSKSLSTAGTLDIAGDINAIWATTDLASGVNISNLSGEALYNAVHVQCVDLIADSCESTSTLNMVVSAYGMYIENDCRTLLNALDKRKTQADSTIRATEREMDLARLDNYDAHNSTSINDCIAQVRSDITANAACGPDYVHCLDVSGRYLNRDTGEPIYTADFYQLEMQVSLSGDVLTNQTNRLLVAELNNKRPFAERGLETCRDLADDVWDEFMRQAIAEIYQGQQERVRQVKNECLDVVNTCYDQQASSLKDFSNVKEQMLLGSRLALSEEMCQQKLDACSNLYGGGPNGLAELLIAMRKITDQKIAKECRATLQDFARDMCAVPSNDSLHSYPYGCRVYAPGEQKYAAIDECNRDLSGELSSDNSGTTSTPSGGESSDNTPKTGGYVCPEKKKYTRCNDGYYMAYNGVPNPVPQPGNQCLKCTPEVCDGKNFQTALCGEDYSGSLYQKMVRYALQVCVRPEDSISPIPTSILADVNMVMDSVKMEMASVLSAECDRLGGYWVDTIWTDNTYIDTDEDGNETVFNGIGDSKHDITGHVLFKRFYNETGANTKWGYCAEKSSVYEETVYEEETQTPDPSDGDTDTGS